MPIEAVSTSPLTPKAIRFRLASIAPVATDGMRPCTELKLCDRLMIIDHGRVLYDGLLEELKHRLLRTKQVKFVLKDTAQAALISAFERDGCEIEQMDQLTHRIRFDRTLIATADLIRQILAAVEVRDLVIEDESIEEIVKRIYAGQASLEIPA